MFDILSMAITLFVISYVIKINFDQRQKFIKYLSGIGSGTKIKIPFPLFVICLSLIAMISLIISIWISHNTFLVNPLLRIISIAVLWEIIIILFVLFIICIFIIIKEINIVNDKLVNRILLFSFLIILLQFIQFKNQQIESIGGSLLINAVCYIFNMICIFHIIGKTFEKEVYVKNVWSTMMINMTFIIINLSSMVYIVQKLPIQQCFNEPIASFSDSLYYVLISFFTVGYGDLYPVDVRAKAISLIIVITGFLFTAVFFGVAMSITTDKIQKKRDDKDKKPAKSNSTKKKGS